GRLVAQPPAPPPLGAAIAPHLHATGLDGLDALQAWAPLTSVPVRFLGEVDPPPAVSGVPPPSNDRPTVRAALHQRPLRANVGAVLRHEVTVPLKDGNHLRVGANISRARWLARGEFAAALNFAEHSEEPERENEKASGWAFTVNADVGGSTGEHLMDGRP